MYTYLRLDLELVSRLQQRDIATHLNNCAFLNA